MSSTPMPSLFVSHGAPTFAIEPGRAGAALGALGRHLPRPLAVVVISPHWMTSGPVRVTLAERPATVHDFSGFPAPLYRLQYPAPGQPQVAQRVLQLLNAAGWPAQPDATRGLDHGAWVPMLHLYPRADVPVFQVSLPSRLDAERAWAFGQALAPLADEGVLICGSGSLTHNLHAYFRGNYPKDAAAPDWVRDFDEWVLERAQAGDLDAISHYDSAGPFARENHPSPEHFLPFPFAFGAGGEGARGERIHTSSQSGVLMLDAYRFQ